MNRVYRPRTCESTYCKNERFAGKPRSNRDTRLFTKLRDYRLQGNELKKCDNKTCKLISHRRWPPDFFLRVNLYGYFVYDLIARLAEYAITTQWPYSQSSYRAFRRGSIYLSGGRKYIHNAGDFARAQTKETTRGMCRRSTPEESARARTCVPRSLNFSSLSSLPRFHFPYIHTCHVSFSFSSLLQQRQWIKRNVFARDGVRLYLERGRTRKRTRGLMYILRRAGGVTLLATSSHDINWFACYPITKVLRIDGDRLTSLTLLLRTTVQVINMQNEHLCFSWQRCFFFLAVERDNASIFTNKKRRQSALSRL